MKLSLVCMCALFACAFADLPKPKPLTEPQPLPQPLPLPQPQPFPQGPQGNVISADEARRLLAELTVNRLKWQRKGSKSYSLTVSVGCFCPQEFRGPFDIVVNGGAITSVAFSASSGLTSTPPNNLNLPTVEGAFSRLEGFLKREGRVAKVTVSYDSELGYIKSLFVDVSELIADEEVSFTFTNLKLTPPKPPVPDRRLIELRINRAKWRALRQRRYVYVLERLCFCAPGFRGPFTVTVQNRRVSKVEPDSGNNSDIPTIEGLFDIIQRALDGTDKVDEITVTYDKLTGVPTRISIDRIKLAIDDEITYTAKLIEGGFPFKLKAPKGPKGPKNPFSLQG